MPRGAAAMLDTFEVAETRSPGSGRAIIPSAPGAPGRTYVCNEEKHCIDVFEDDDEPLFSFGEFGNGPGQFNEPADVVVVFLQSRGNAGGSATPSGQVLVVADRGNHRLQLFSLEGTPLATIDPWLGRSRRVDLDDRSGWPFFRVNPLPQMVLPSTLEWRAPFLSVTGGDGRVVAVDLELALLYGAVYLCLVFTGGGAALLGMAEIAEQIFDLPVRRAAPDGVGGLADHVNNPAFATGVGLALYTHRHAQSEPVPTGAGAIGRLTGKLRMLFKEFF